MFLIVKKYGCPECERLHKYMNEKGTSDIEIRYAEDCMDFCREWNIRSVPTLMIPVSDIKGILEYRKVNGVEEIVKYMENENGMC